MNILITGSSQGIGEAIARKFLSEGHFVVGFDRQDATEEQIQHKNFKFCKLDIMNKDNLPNFDFSFHVIINNAGSLIEREALTGKLLGAYYITEKYAFQKQIKSVVNISSNSAHFGIEMPLYCMANGAMISYTKNLAKRLAQYQATCNSISPGYVDTTLEQHLKDNELDSKVYEGYLLHHIQKPTEIADWVYFLSVINQSMTGQDILVDNGESIAMKFIETPENLALYYNSQFKKGV